MTSWRERLLSPWLTVRAAFVLAAVFVVAGIAKIADPPQFAHEVHNYALLPESAVNALALLLPWIEVIAGVFLFLGVWRRAAAGILGVSLLVFIVALSINLARGRAVDCGCFGGAHAPRTTAERLLDMKLAIVRDVGLLLLVALVIRPSHSRESDDAPASSRVPAVGQTP
jgi:uncharacterized membrane protein YphA (DoxX/SURF4 family)